MTVLLSKALKPFCQRKETPAALGFGTGWVRELDRAWENGHYAVMARDLQTEWGRITHYFIRNVGNTDIPWADKQIIKNKLAGYEKVAVEVFPPQAELVDEAGAYHLWVLHDMKLPFTLHEQ